MDQFIENGYWQYFCGFEYFQHEFPLDPTIMVKWRKRIGFKRKCPEPAGLLATMLERAKQIFGQKRNDSDKGVATDLITLFERFNRLYQPT